MAAASAHALNCVADADIDVKMKRTARRPLAQGRVPPRHALVFGLVLGAAQRGVAGASPPTCWRRGSPSRRSRSTCSSTRCCSSAAPRRTSCGAARRAACRSSSGGPRSPAPSAGPRSCMFAVIFFWTPPHFWALAMRYRDDYAAAGVPMLPVVAAPRAGDAAHRRLRLGDGRRHAGAAARHVLDLRGRRGAAAGRGSCSRPTGCTRPWSRAARSARWRSSTAPTPTCAGSSSRSPSTPPSACLRSFRSARENSALLRDGRSSPAPS